MPRLKWGAAGERFYESGVDQGVLYLRDKDGIPWNGLKAINEEPNGGEATPYYLDGFKYANLSATEEYGATLEALSAPEAFAECDGLRAIHNGLFADHQPRKAFGLAYRTRIGNDINGVDLGYKIHLVYNAMASPSGKGYSSLGDNTDPIVFSWSLSAIPEKVPGIRSTAHLIIDSRKANRVTLAYLEAVLFGAEGMVPHLPPATKIVEIFAWAVDDANVPLNFYGVATSDQRPLENLATNPSFERSSSVIEVRRNLITNPSFAVDLTGWSAGPSGTLARQAGSSDGNGSATFTGAASGSDLGPRINVSGLTVGYTYIFSLNVHQQALFSPQGIRLGVFHNNKWSTGAWDTEVLVTKRISVVFVAEATSAILVAGSPATANASVPPALYFDRAMLEVGNKHMGYFDGSTQEISDSDLTPAWLGTPGLSASVLRGTSPAAIVTPSTTRVIQSSRNATSRSKSMRLVAISPVSADSPVDIGGSGTSLSGNGISFEAGKTYTVVAKVSLEAAQSGMLSTYARSIMLASNSISGWTGATYQKSDTAPNAPGTYEIRWTFTVPANAIWAILRFYNGGTAGDSDVWFDDFLLVEGVYTGPYFDGESEPFVYNSQMVDPGWYGTPDNSKSDIILDYNLPQNANQGDARLINGSMFVFDNGYWANFGNPPAA